MTYDTMSVPTDGSEAVDPTLDHAFDLVGAFDSTVHALFVADTNRDRLTVVGTELVEEYAVNRDVDVGEQSGLGEFG